MSLKLNNIVGNLFNTLDKKQAEEKAQKDALQQKINNAFGITSGGSTSKVNPYLNSKGELVNKYLDYQSLLDNPKVSNLAKKYIKNATGLSPTASVINSTMFKPQTTVTPVPTQGTGAYTGSVGKKIANTASYNNSGAKGQCVWYVRGRATEKLGKDTGAIGNANEMWYNAKADAKLPATVESIKPDTIASYKYGSGGNKYGHVIYIEDVVGDTVYYTEGGTYHTKNGTTGVVKTASKSEIMNGGKLGQNLIGFIDLSRY